MARDRRHRATRKEIANIARTAKIAEIERPAIADIGRAKTARQNS
jgi:hypothetical protein